MSGSTIGGVVGGVIGWVVGGPAGAQWGFMIGSAVGAIVDPQKFEGPRLGEAKTQTANDGVPLIYGYGTFPCAGNLAWVDSVKEHKKTESAKGGPETTTYTYTVSYMIVVCKGEISGYKIIKRNGKIVYDARTDAELSALGYSGNEIAETRAAQSSFLQRATLYYGTQSQMPDPTMVAVKGAGEVPAYTGIAYIVMKDDETREGEVSQYEFVVANCGERSELNSLPFELLVTGQSFAKSNAGIALEFSPIPPESGADIVSATPAYNEGMWVAASSGSTRYSTDGMLTWQAGATPWSSSITQLLPIGGNGWFFVNTDFATSGLYGTSANPPLSVTQQSYEFGGVETDYIYSMFRVGGSWVAQPFHGTLYGAGSLAGPWTFLCDSASTGGGDANQGIYWFLDIVEFEDSLCACVQFRSGAFGEVRWRIVSSFDGGKTWPEILLDAAPGDEIIQLAVNAGYLIGLVWGSEYVYTSADGFSNKHLTGIATARGANPGWETLARQIVSGGGRVYVVSGNSPNTSKQNRCVSTVNGITFTSPVPTGVASTKGVAIGDGRGFGTAIPDAPGYYIDPITGEINGPSGTQVDVCRPTLGQIVADQCDRRGVVSRNVSELTDDVGGYRVAAPSTPQRNIQGLQPGYFFGASEFDGVLHFPKRGRPLTFSLAHDDFVEREGDSIKWERTQETELLRKVTVAYVDPDTTYTATTQDAERRAATISAKGESTIELAVTGSKDWAAQAADKSIKVAWGEVDECTFHVSIGHADLVTGAEGTVPYIDGSNTAIRIDRIEDEGLVRMVTGRRTRKNLYESNASGAAKPLPRFPGSNMRGPTDGLLMNIPVLVDANDFPGIHWAASGMLSGWQGAQLQILRAGQWLVAGTTGVSASIGTLVSPLPAHAGDIDTANVLHVRLDANLESVTFVNLLQERNPLAIMRDDGTAEIVQFQHADEIAPGEYELSMLLRSRLATTSGDHAPGARVVFLDDGVQYTTLDASDIGQNITYRFVSLGTDPDAAEVRTLDLTTMESQSEWPVPGFAVSQDGDDYTLTWLRRDRLGTDTFPIRSSNWAGYVVGWEYGGMTHQEVVTTETITFNLPGASDITFSVAQVNQFTGNGPESTVHIP